MTRHEKPRADGRSLSEIRKIEVNPDFVEEKTGVVLYSSGKTRVICVASLEEGTPNWITRQHGWLTAEYSLLPYSTTPRANRNREERPDGRTQEVQRLIGRTLRASLDLHRFPGYTIRIDCDVVQADGGTRTASINGAAIALGLLIREACQEGRFAEDPRVSLVAAISAGIVAGEAYLDLDYSEDHRAEIDLNLVGTPEGELVEVQGSSESQPISWERWQQLIELGLSGLRQVGEQSQRWVPPLAGSERV